jgi:hypothetical protein
MANMTITRRSDGNIALDWGDGGPFVTLTGPQWRALLTEIRKGAP